MRNSTEDSREPTTLQPEAHHRGTDQLKKDSIVLQKERHLKWRKLDAVESILMWLCGLLLAAFTAITLLDVTTRLAGTPIAWLQEAILGAFVWGTFLGGAVAVRRNQHFILSEIAKSLNNRRRLMLETVNHLIVLAVSLCVATFGFAFFLQTFGVLSQPSGVSLAIITAAIPVSGLLITLFTVERLVNGWRRGFASSEETEEVHGTLVDSGGAE